MERFYQMLSTHSVTRLTETGEQGRCIHWTVSSATKLDQLISWTRPKERTAEAAAEDARLWCGLTPGGQVIHR
jgi:hypothetical protein